MSQMQVNVPGQLNADRPIETAAQDRLGRTEFALSIARQICSAPPAESFVIALVGAWGSGKTSILNMIEEHIAHSDQSVLFIRFNPWLFAGHQQLVAHFFQEVASQIREVGGQELREVWRGFEGYSRLLRPLRAVTVGTEDKALTELSAHRQRKLLEGALLKVRRRLVIVVDDIDRLQNEEIRDVMRLVRLVADFSNTVYLLSYDQVRVENALGGEGEPGKAYLEKVVQISHHVPQIREDELAGILAEKVDNIVSATAHISPNNALLQDMFHQGIKPLFRGLRDIYRYVNVLRPTLEQIGQEVALPDLLAMEALRITHPTVFAGAVIVARELNDARRINDKFDDQKKKIVEVVSKGGDRAEYISRLLQLVFPNMGAMLGGYHHGGSYVKTWRKERRIACPEVLAIYLERAIPKGTLSSPAVRDFFDNLGAKELLSERLTHMSPDQIEHLLKRLESYEDDFRPETVAVAVSALAEQLPRLREGRTHIFDMGADMALSRVIFRLLRRVEPAQLSNILDSILSHLGKISSQKLVADIAIEGKLVKEEDIERLEAKLAQRVLHAPPDELASEPQLMRLLCMVERQSRVSCVSKLRTLVMHERAFLRLLASALSEARSQPMGSVVGEVEYYISRWDDIQRIVGKKMLADSIGDIKSRQDELSLSEREKIALEAALRHLTGWRHERHTGEPPSDSKKSTEGGGSSQFDSEVDMQEIASEDQALECDPTPDVATYGTEPSADASASSLEPDESA